MPATDDATEVVYTTISATTVVAHVKGYEESMKCLDVRR